VPAHDLPQTACSTAVGWSIIARPYRQAGLGDSTHRQSFSSNHMTHLRLEKIEHFLALDIHPRSFGFAVFENADLLHWGVRRWKSGQQNIAIKKLCQLIDLWRPSRILIREGAPPQCRKTVLGLARRHHIRVRNVARADVKSAFQPLRRVSRFDIARTVVEYYPELKLRLPLNRPLGHAEPLRMRMFNAVATGMAFVRNGYDDSPAKVMQR